MKKYRIFSLVTDAIYIFTVEKNRTVAKQCFLGNFVTGIFEHKVLSEVFVKNNATHVVKSTSNIMTSLFDLA